MSVRRVLLPLVLLLVATTLLSCGSTDIVTYVPEGGIHGADDLTTLIASANLGDTAAVTTGKAPEVRQDALTQLRGYGDDAAALADTLTSDFPLDMAAVPVYVERGSYEDEPVWIVIEATADGAGTLTSRRLWVLSYTEGTVIAALSAP
jgi:hypothetical protein